MFPLDSPDWRQFHTYFGTPEEVPQRLLAWKHSIGSPDEERSWYNLYEQFLHQMTITDAAYAVVPHIVAELHRIEPRKRFDCCLMELAIIESARQSRGSSAKLPPTLAQEYYESIKVARQYAVELLSLSWTKVDFRFVISIVASLHDHGRLGDLIFNLDAICADCPDCGQTIYPELVRDSGYV